MTKTITCRMKPYIQPFEHTLALEELSAITGVEPRPLTSSNGDTEVVGGLWGPVVLSAPDLFEFEVTSDVSLEILVEKLAYWESVCENEKYLTAQVLREATVNVVRNGIALNQIGQHFPLGKAAPLPNRRNLRYGMHGIHEYRGKFFPQLVRSLINIAKVPDNGIVADPMCGSGTTIVEAVLAGHRGVGLDYNPLSVLMSRTKCDLLSVDPELIIHEYQTMSHCLQQEHSAAAHPTLSYFSSLSVADQKYLKEWFSERVLRDLDRITSTIYRYEDGPLRNLMLLSLSNIIRHVSWQKDDDLRVRKEIREDDNSDPIKEFLKELWESVKTVVAFLYQNRGSRLGVLDIRESDARTLETTWHELLGKVDVVITSPPYATALPYLDTDRLSLYYLGLLSRAGHRKRDRDMIGNREIDEKLRLSYWRRFQGEKNLLPECASQLIESIEQLNSTIQVGFRRKNLASLLSKYFLDMREVLSGIAQILKPGGHAYLVIGNNHTVAGGQRVEIETANILRNIALMVGLEEGRHISMEMLVSRDIFSHNAVASEVILTFKRPL